MKKESKSRLFQPEILRRALWDAVKKLHPKSQVRNPVMFVTRVNVTTVRPKLPAARASRDSRSRSRWLWFTVYFANFSEGRSGRARQGAGRKV